MKHRLASISGIAMALAASAPIAANTPPPVPMFSYYGPVRHCGDGFALEARAGEGLIVVGGFDAMLRIGRHNLGVSRFTAGYAIVTDPAIIRQTGTLTIEGVGTLARYRVSAGQPDDARVTYLFDPGGGVDRARRIEIGSDLFDGSERDRAMLARVAFGDHAKAQCEAVPPALRPTPERVQADAFLMRGARYPGPLTVCWAHLALHAVAGESVVLPWDPDQNRFALVAPGLSVGITGDFRSGANRTGAPLAGVAGALLGLPPYYGIVAGSNHVGVVFDYMPTGTPVTNRARLVAVADVRMLGPDPGPGLTFTFSRPLPDAERDAFIGRVRVRATSDHCFDPDRA